MKKILAIVLALLTLCAGTAMAATQADIQLSISKGLTWLAAQQKADGSWDGGGGDFDIGATGLALLKFEAYAKELGYKPTDPNYKYSGNVINGTKFLDSSLNTTSVAGGYDGNSNGDMTHLGSFEQTYLTGIALMAYSSNPSTSPVLIQDLTDWFVNTQCTNSTSIYYGGWIYTPTIGCASDNSNTGYATLGLGYALNAGASIPASTKTALSAYVDYIQNKPGPADNGTEVDPDGGSGYVDPTFWVNSLKTGSLIFEAVISGDAANSSRIMNATDYINRHWNDNIQGWKGNLSAPTPYNTQYQATFNIMKGFEAIGLSNLNGLDWFDNMSTVIVNDQLPSGNWTECPAFVTPGGFGAAMVNDNLCTAWALLTLEKVTPIAPKGSISGMKFEDLNGNGTKDIGEPGLAGWTITLKNESGGIVINTTDASGNYTFTNLVNGNYTVAETLKPGWMQTAPATGTYMVSIKVGAEISGLDFGNKRLPPKAFCNETVNPAGKKVPPAGSTTLPGSKGGQNEDGFYELQANGFLPPFQIFVRDNGSGTIFPLSPPGFSPGTKIKYTQAPGATPSIKMIGGPDSAVAWHITGKGDAVVYAMNNMNIKSAEVFCLVPPPPK